MTDQRASSGTSSSASNSAVVLSQVHVSCFITAANRATPVFEVLPERKCVRIVSKPPDDRQSTSPGSAGASGTSVYATPGTTVVPTAEWDFHTLFPSSASSHGSDFYREITLPAFRTVCEGVNTNIITLGVHPTQKFRLLFGKSTGNIELTTALASPSHSFDEKEILELYGQLGGLLNEFFTRVHQSQGTGISRAVGGSSSSNAFRPSPWRLGISSWIVVNNQVVDLLKPASAASSTASTSGAPSTSSATPLSFASLEAKTFASACKIVQIAKTNRIVLKQNAEHAHFFLRLAFFHDGQVSTLHLADLIDLKDFKDATSSAEKHELFEILTELRQPPSIPARSPMTPSKQPSASGFKARKMVLSSFLVPLLTANAKSFLYANIIDSRSSLRECVTLLNAVANVKGYACACKRLQGVNFIQLGFQSPPFEMSEKEAEDKESKQNEEVRDAAAKALAAVSIGESLLSRLGSSSPLSSSFGSLTSTRMPTYQGFQAQIDSNIVVSDKRKLFEAPSPPPPASESMSWLQAFNQRKNDILGGTVDSIAAPASLTHQSTQDADTVNSIPSAPQQTADEYPAPTSSLSLMQQQPPECSADFGVRLDSPSPPSAQIYPVSAAAASPQTNTTFSKAFEAASEPQRTSPQQKPPRDEKSAALEMYERLKDSMAHQRAEKTPVRRSSSLPLPLSDESHSGSDLNSQGDLFSICRSPVSPQIGLLETPASFSYAPSPLPPPAPSPHLMSSPSLRSGSTFPGSTRNPAPALSPFPSPSPLLSVMAFEGMEDTFERANVPTRVLAPPDLDGLDAATAGKVHAIDAALLRRNYDALLTIVHEQQQLREAAEAQAAEALHDQEELRATYEIQIENMKLSNVSLRSKLRALEQQTSVAKVFDQYEQELQSLTKELQQLRSRNVALELQVSMSIFRACVVGCSEPGLLD